MSAKITVLMMPDYREGNPFQQLLTDSLLPQGVEVVFAKGYKRVFPIYREVKKYTGVDLLHLHWITPYLKGKNWFVFFIYSGKFVLDLLLTKFIIGTRIVWTIHNQVSHDSKFPATEKIVYRITSRLANAAILHGNSLKEIILKDYKIKESDLNIIHLGNYQKVYPKRVDRAIARRAMQVPGNIQKVFLNQGLLKPYKGIEDLIAVWKLHHTELSGQLLIVAGKATDPEFEDQLQKQIGDCSSIRLMPRFVTDEEVTLLHSACDVVVLPFRKIMASSSLMVAISFGRSVIAPRIGATEELLGDADELLYDAGDIADGLYQSIIKSLNGDLLSLETKTLTRADEFNWDDIGFKTRALYKRVLTA